MTRDDMIERDNLTAYKDWYAKHHGDFVSIGPAGFALAAYRFGASQRNEAVSKLVEAVKAGGNQWGYHPGVLNAIAPFTTKEQAR